MTEIHLEQALMLGPLMEHHLQDLARLADNPRVASTVRDAHVRDFHNIVLEDGCAAFSDAAHKDSIASLSTIATVSTVADLMASLD